MRFKSNLKFINFSSEINSRVKNYEWIDFQLNHATTSKIKNTDILKNNFHDFITLGLYAYFVRLNNYFDFTCYYDKYQTSFKILLIEKIKEINILDFLNIPNHISRYLYADNYDNYPYDIAILTKNSKLSKFKNNLPFITIYISNNTSEYISGKLGTFCVDEYWWKTLKEYFNRHINNWFHQLMTLDIKYLRDLCFLDYEEKTSQLNNLDDSMNFSSKETLQELICKMIFKKQDTIALKFNDQIMTYMELQTALEKLICYFSLNGLVKKGDRVAIISNKNLELVVIIYAVILSGGVYMPLDAESFNNLDLEIFNNHEIDLLVTDRLYDYSKLVNFKIVSVQNISSIIYNKKKIQNNKVNNFINQKVQQEDPAYIIHTSGSTGTAKGVKVSHYSVAHQMCWLASQFDFTEKDVFYLKTKLNFDASIWELFFPICIGATLIISHEQTYKNVEKISDDINRHKITVLQIVPVILEELIKLKTINDLSSLKYIFCGGDSIGKVLKLNFFDVFKNIRFINLYGPSECTVNSTFYEIKKDDLLIEKNIIGKPIDRMGVFVADIYHQLMPQGFYGEICIYGAGVAIGYTNSLKANAECFIDNADITTRSKIYLTKDIGYYLPDKNLVFCGRSSRTVKINGVFVNLDEVENKISLFRKNTSAFAIKYEYEYGSILAVGVYSEIYFDIEDIYSYLRNDSGIECLPNVIVHLNDFPVSSSGKVNRNKVFEIISERKNANLKKIKNEDDINAIIKKLWLKIFWFLEDINIDKCFFHLSNNSLQAAQLVNLLSENFRISLSISFVMLSDTIRKQALYFSENIDNKLTNKTSAVVKNFIKLKEGKNNLNLFLFAPVSGLVFWYTKLSSYLNLDFTIYGIQDASINENHNIFNSFDELINTYYKALIHFQNNGLFFIGGASFGATVAVEIVNRLENNRMNVCFLGLFDGWALYPAIFKDKNFFKQLMERQILRFENNNIFQSTEHTNLIEIQRQRMLSLFNYNPPSINSPACLFKASELLPEYLEIDNRTNYWEEYISHLKLIVTSGNHESMFEDPHVKKLSDSLERELISAINRFILITLCTIRGFIKETITTELC